MYSERDYQKLLPQVIEKLYEDSNDRELVVKLLNRYRSPESDRVKLGIIRVAQGSISELKQLVNLAKQDYRDLLCAAEYPLTASRYSLSKKDPEQYRALQLKEVQEYDDWLKEIFNTF